MNTQKIFDTPLLGLGFRVFFALAGLSALILIVLWNAIFKGTLTAEHYFTNSYWHAHEMLLGYSVAVIAGFLLTAVKNWTGKPTLTGDNLAGLALLWLYGRILPFYAGLLPDALIAAVDFAFLPTLAYQISKPIMQARHFKSLVFIGLLVLLTLGNGLIHAEILGLSQNTAWTGIQLVVATIIILILILAGRVFPFFTERGLSGTLIIRNPLLDALSIGSAVVGLRSATLGCLRDFSGTGRTVCRAGEYRPPIRLVCAAHLVCAFVMDTVFGVWLDYSGVSINRIGSLFMGSALVSITCVYHWRHRCVNLGDDGAGIIRPYRPGAQGLKCYRTGVCID